MENSMEKLDRDIDGSSLNIVESNIEQLKALFPDAVSEGKIDFDKLREALGHAVETQEERYNFNWNGKALAKRIAQTQSTGTLRPCKAESKHWDSTKNLFIEGDNLEVLKLLQKSYHKQVKMIYIDPPYNTGNEFIYPDNYKDNLDTYLQYTHQKDDEGRRFGTNADTSGRYHTNWLNMMYPRLKLARNLLRDDGVIFISIDDNEVTNLRKLCDEIFGEENFVANIVWQSKKGGGSDNSLLVEDHEYVLCYCKQLREVRLGTIEVQAEPLDREDEKGRYRLGRELNKWGSNSRREDRPTMYFPISGPNNEDVYPIRNDGSEGRWRWGKKNMMEIVNTGNVEFVPRNNGTFIVHEKIRTEDEREKPYRTWFSDVGTTADGSKIVKNLFDDVKVFDFPKPLDLLERSIDIGILDSGYVLDFFSGSCATSHAVMNLNAKDNGNRKFIMVQLPEPCDEKTEAYKAGYKTIADIGKERIRRAGEKILNATKDGIEALDIGFKVFKLDSSNIKPWDADFDNLDDTLLNIVDNIKEDRSEDDVLTEILLKYGLDLTVPIEERQVSGKTVYIIGFGVLVVCLADVITLEVVEGIGHLKAELAPEVMRVVFKDSGFKDDVVKTNAIQILKQYGIDDVKSL